MYDSLLEVKSYLLWHIFQFTKSSNLPNIKLCWRFIFYICLKADNLLNRSNYYPLHWVLSKHFSSLVYLHYLGFCKSQAAQDYTLLLMIAEQTANWRRWFMDQDSLQLVAGLFHHHHQSTYTSNPWLHFDSQEIRQTYNYYPVLCLFTFINIQVVFVKGT